MKKNCIVAQSGGPTSAINASLAGVLNAALSCGEYDTVYGSLHGIEGILKGNYKNLSYKAIQSPDFVKQLKQTPAMYLGSCRFKLPSEKNDPKLYEQIFSELDALNIGAFFYIGGNDSMDTVMKLSVYGKSINSEIRFIGVPKTIDNDLCATDHTPGFGSAAKYVATSILEMAHDIYIYDLKSVTIIEVMGRDAGWLTAASCLARTDYSAAPHLIYLPESPFDRDRFIDDVKKVMEEHSNVIVAVSEGIRDKDGTYISASGSTLDNFGHVQLNGAGRTLENLVKDRLGVKVRSVEFNILQRCAEHIASATDLDESFTSGEKAVSFALEGVTGAMVIMKRSGSDPYRIEYDHADISGIANEEKSVPTEWIVNGNDVSDAMYQYLRPLIQGEVHPSYENGIPKYLNVSHLG
ncbi:MAG: 6-phosphofructokinase [Lachnospiraceae bacterium]